MAVIGAKGNFPGPGGSPAFEEEGRIEITCTQVSGDIRSHYHHHYSSLQYISCHPLFVPRSTQSALSS